eukprot:gnl/MRDRNA2_/MRDRNA2_57262_c0_seq1.p1 gnl/MRDRNA2_/MRDRNA2_57262_c0~~gnl/MRDRNA2_/MRDRNA2_57262_c0_seq1.p1  ORF type:complete len:371 (+),score=40.02 gnl/MRDRNA2_/MRDRNA2_57262_c0_seq1:430-1542(+)
MTGFQLPTRPYCVGCDEQNLSKVVDANGNNAGMTTFVKAMVAAAGQDVHFYFDTQVVELKQLDGRFGVVLANGTTVAVRTLILALPQQPLVKLLRASPTVVMEGTKVADFMSNYRALHRIRASAAVKLYVLYEDAWWVNYLNLTSGHFNNSAAPEQQTSGTAVPQFPPLVGRYHDGDVRCDPKCRGFLETTYAFDDASVAFYRPYRAGDGQPFTLIGSDPLDIAGSDFLEAVHAELIHFHTDALKSKGALEYVRGLRPSLAVLSIWDEAARGFGGAIHDWFRDDRITATCSGFSDCQQKMPPKLMQPLSTLPLYIVGEAFGSRNGWMESALGMAENVLHKFYGLPKPWWIDEETYRKDVLFNSSMATYFI